MPAEIVNVESFHPAGDGRRDDQAALQRAFDAAASGVLLFPDARKIYRIKGFGLRIRANTRILNPGARLLLAGSVPAGDGTPAVVADEGLQADALRIEVAARSRVNRALTLASDSSVERLEISGRRQQGNHHRLDGKPWSAALDVRGERVRLGDVAIRSFDRALLVRDASHVRVERIQIERCVTGVYLKGCRWTTIASGAIAGDSPSDVGDREPHDNVAGMNGLLVDTCEDLFVSNLAVRDTIEHGVRIGGRGPTRRCVFTAIQVHRAGKCGFKAQPRFSDGGSAKSIQINGLMVTDCAPASGRLGEADRYRVDGTNRCGLRIENCQDVTVTGYQLDRRGNRFYSAAHGLFVAQSTDVTVVAPRIADAWSSGIVLTDEHHERRQPVNQVYVRDPVVTYLVPGALAGREVDGIRVNSTQEILRNVLVTGCYVRGQTGWGVRVVPQAGGARWPVVLQGWARDEGRGALRVDPDDRDIHKRIDPV